MRFSKVTLLLAMGFVLEGCAPVLIPMDKDALARLPHQSEILAGHHSRPAPRPRPQSSYWLPTSPHPIGNAIGVGILLLQLAANNAASAPSDYCWNDPVTKVKERFTAALNDQFGLANVRVIDEPLSGSDPEELKAALGPSAVIDFRTLDCRVGSDEGQLEAYSSEARLLFLQDLKISWQGRCSVRRPGQTGNEVKATGPSGDFLIETNRDDAITLCVAELIEQFNR